MTETTVSEDAAQTANKVEIDLRADVVEALLGSGSETLDVEASVSRLQQVRCNIVRVNAGKSKVRIWIDEKS